MEGPAPMWLMGFSAAFTGLTGSLLLIGIRGWQRTRSLRCGRSTQGPHSNREGSSVATRLAAWAGAAGVAWGAIFLGLGHVSGALVAAWGGAIALSGWRSRVTGLLVDRTGLWIRYARRTAFRVEWVDCRALRPPRSPVGGWTVITRSSRRMLMPSDVLGHEAALEAIVRGAGLRFDGSAWIRPT